MSEYQPVSEMQLNQLKIEWVPLDQIQPNKYNPNRMTYHDRMLLRQSILEDGWTQPIIVLPDGIIIDGEQRWTIAQQKIQPAQIQEIVDHMLSRRDRGIEISQSVLDRLYLSKERLETAIARGLSATVGAITHGLVPITTLDLGDDAHKMISTIRHNRARGTHQVDAMAGITQDLVQLGLEVEDLEVRLGMDDEEISRFLRAAEGMLDDLQAETAQLDYSKAFRPVHIAELEEDDEALSEITRSKQAAQDVKQYQIALAQRESTIRQKQELRVRQIETEEARGLTQEERDKIRREIEKELPALVRPAQLQLKKLVIMVTQEEYALIERVTQGVFAVGIVSLCKQADQERVHA